MIQPLYVTVGTRTETCFNYFNREPQCRNEGYCCADGDVAGGSGVSGDNKRYWFHAKTYGYGWTLPVTWEGWLVIVIYLILLLGAIRMLADTSSAVVYAYIAVITALLVVICWFKGERPRWRWGGRKDAL